MPESAPAEVTLANWRRQERAVLVVLAVVLLLFLPPALREARRMARDEQRITDLASIKRRLEDFYNVSEEFPRTSETEPLACTASRQGSGEGLLRHPFFQDTPLPKERRKGWFPYVYCPTATAGHGKDLDVVGFFLQTALEHPRKEDAGFDLEEGRNYLFHVYRDGSLTFYRICGGTDLSCRVTEDEL